MKIKLEFKSIEMNIKPIDLFLFRILIIILFLFSCFQSESQEKHFLDSRRQEICDSAAAECYYIIFKNSLDTERSLKVFYDLDGTIRTESNYYKNKKEGLTSNYYKNGTILSKIEFTNDLINGTIMTYWPNGNVRRKENYIKGLLKDGNCFDENGKQIKFFPMNESFTISGRYKDIYEYTIHNYRYPKRGSSDTIKGEVKVEFNVTKDSKISDVRILKGLSEDIDQEVIKTILKIPIKLPQRFEGEPADILCTILLKFPITATNAVFLKSRPME